jgi:hypothetical protein
MTKIIHLPTSHRDRGSAPKMPASMENIVAIRMLRAVSVTGARRAEGELLDRVWIWINESGWGGDIQ